MSGQPRLSVLAAMMTAMGKRDAVLHPRHAAAALGVSRGALRRAGGERCYGRAEIAELASDPPRWRIAAGAHRNAQRDRQRLDRERRVARQADQLALAEAYLRAIKDHVDTGWAASALPAAGIHRINLGDGDMVPVLAPQLKVVC
jgi:hypothetical protein